MEIRIDESGGFIALGPGTHRVSAVGALVLPTLRLDELYAEYQALRSNFPSNDGEVKGSKLHETEVASVIELLLQYDVIFDSVVCDAASHRHRDILGFQSQQVDIVRSSVGQLHHPEMIEEVNELADRLKSLPAQLFLQHQMTIELVDRVLRHAPLYLVQRCPAELGSFRWIVDAKGEKMTKYEEVWSKLVFPSQQARTAKNPHPVLRGADYSYFEPFLIDNPSLPGPPYLPEDESDLRVIDLRKVLMEGLTFEDSKNELGLELVDIVTNGLTRAMNGRLQRHGWQDLGRLMIRMRDQTLRMVVFRAQKAEHNRVLHLKDHFNGVADVVEATARDMMHENFSS